MSGTNFRKPQATQNPNPWEGDGLASKPDPVADTRRATAYGDLIGLIGPLGNPAWLGIPYAAPPVGSLRWRAPQPLQPWQGVLQASAFGSPACQCDYYSDRAASSEAAYMGSEDCLYLNIFAPRAPATAAAGQRWPVMVWIHGGGNEGGHAGTFDGSLLATTQSIVVVTVNYRLGIFGWFRHPALRTADSSAEDDSGNYGTLDLISALRWVRENIEAFGGDKESITICGESAGAWNVFSMMASPLAAGLFHRAIIQSGSPVGSPVTAAENFVDDPIPGDMHSSAELLLQLLIDDGIAEGREEAKRHLMRMSAGAISHYLHAKEFSDFDRACVHISKPVRYFPQLFLDGTVLPSKNLAELFATTDNYNKVPVLIGSNRDEFTVLLAMMDTPFVRHVEGLFEVEIRDFEKFYLGAEYLSNLLRAQGVESPATVLSKRTPDSVFVYRFDWDELTPATWAGGLLLKATHGLDVTFVFGSLDIGPEFFFLPLIPAQSMDSFQRLSECMMSYWAEFAATGQPGQGRNKALAHWKPWQSESEGERHRYMVLQSFAKGGPQMMSGYSLDKEAVLAALRTDSRFASSKERCQFLHDLIIAGEFVGLHPDDLKRFENSACT